MDNTQKLQVAREALERINRWHGEFPATGQQCEDGSAMSYSTCYGSNGERDYMRKVADDALASIAAPSAPPVAESMQAPNKQVIENLNELPRLYRFDVLDRHGVVLAEGIGVHAISMAEAMLKTKTMGIAEHESARFKSNDPCHPRIGCAICRKYAARAVGGVNANKYLARADWTYQQWWEHVGAWENESGQICFGSPMAVRAMLIQARATTALLVAAKPEPQTEEIEKLRDDLTWHKESLRRHAEKLKSIWAGIAEAVERHTGKPCSSEPFNDLAAVLAAAKDGQDDVARPDLLEHLTYHAHERDDMTVDELLQTLSNGYHNVRQRSHRQLELQLLALLASAPAAPAARPVAWIRRHPDGRLTGELLLDAVIEPVRKTSGAWVPLGALPLGQDPLVLRAQGRAEVLNIILDLDPETGLDNCCGSHALADTGDYSTHWDEAKLRELLHVDDTTYAAFDKAEAAYWECLGHTDEARHAAALAQNAPGCAKLRTLLIDLGEISLLHELMTVEPFQARVQPWLLECFGADIAADRVERNHRFLEEALELVQACGCTADEAHQLVDYVFGRDVGEPAQEVGGVMVTLAALCLAQGLDMAAAGETELTRIWTKVEAIRAKQAAKPKYGPLPGPTPPPAGAACEICDGTRVAFGKRCECTQGAEP